jgi:hypothetical protein
MQMCTEIPSFCRRRGFKQCWSKARWRPWCPRLGRGTGLSKPLCLHSQFTTVHVRDDELSRTTRGNGPRGPQTTYPGPGGRGKNHGGRGKARGAAARPGRAAAGATGSHCGGAADDDGTRERQGHRRKHRARGRPQARRKSPRKPGGGARGRRVRESGGHWHTFSESSSGSEASPRHKQKCSNSTQKSSPRHTILRHKVSK